LLLLFGAGSVAAQVTLTEGTNFSVHAARDGRLVIDLLGGLWILPATGGTAEPVPTTRLPARRPRWSPASDALVYQARGENHDQLWFYDFAGGIAHNLSSGEFLDQHPNWHPDGERVVFSSDRRNTGFDLWELDLETRLSWRITNGDGDETEPAWSADGRDLVYIQHAQDQWSLMLRRHGQPDRAVTSSSTRLSSPEWRPDGSLITFLRHTDDGLSIDMAILSDPPLVRPLVGGEDLFIAPVTWLDRERLLYTANGVIRQRHFNSWSSTTLPFRVTVTQGDSRQSVRAVQRTLPQIDAPSGQLVIRAARLFDGIGGGYQDGLDIVIDGARIAAVEARRDRPGAIVVDMGDLTALPGLIDSYAVLPPAADEALGPLLLSFGVTSIVANHDHVDTLNETWSGKAVPGPRVLAAEAIGGSRDDAAAPWLVTISGDLAAGAALRSSVTEWLMAGVPVLAENWQVGLGSGASLLLGTESLPASPRGQRYGDIQLSSSPGSVTIVSGIADSQTPGITALLNSRQATLLGPHPPARRRFESRPVLGTGAGVILGSEPNGLPPGIAQHAELRALKAAGLTNEQVLRAAGVNAASALGLGLQVGRIAPGAAADIVLVDGDPLLDINAAMKVVGVVRNGRFFSTIGLLDRVQSIGIVE
jgi:hypothetical protein